MGAPLLEIERRLDDDAQRRMATRPELFRVAPYAEGLADIYRSIVPFVFVMCLGLALVMAFPEIALWLRRVSPRRALVRVASYSAVLAGLLLFGGATLGFMLLLRTPSAASRSPSAASRSSKTATRRGSPS